ncbi:MAG: glycosyltransferase family 4 protein [Opitutales bacterium]
MKICIANDFACPNGGASKVAITEAMGLSESGHDVYYFAESGPIDESLMNSNVSVVCANRPDILSNPSRINACIRGIANKHAYDDLSDLINRFDEDWIVHVHSYSKALSPYIFKIGEKTSVQLYHTLHDYFIGCPQGGFFDKQKESVCKLKGGSFQCLKTHCDARSFAQKVWRFGRWVYQENVFSEIACLPQFIAVSEYLKSRLLNYLPAGAKVDVLDNPIDAVASSTINVEENHVYGFVGRLVAEKGIFHYAEAIRKSGKRGVIIGDGDESVIQRVKEICPNLEIKGWLQGDALLSEISSFRALIFPSIYYEGQPLTPLEHMALGIPVVSSNTNAAIDYMEDGVNGFVYDGDSVDSLVAAIEKIEERGVAGKLGARAKAWYKGRDWSIDGHIRKLERLYGIR